MNLLMELTDLIEGYAPSLIPLLKTPLKNLLIRVLAREFDANPDDIEDLINKISKNPLYKIILLDLEKENHNILGNLLMSFQEDQNAL